MKDEYKVIILDPSPKEAKEQLMLEANSGWHVMGTYCEDRIILRRSVYEEGRREEQP